MAKILSEKQVREKAVDAFEFNPKVDKLYGTADGQMFLQGTHAKLHAKQAGKAGKPLKVYEIEREEKGDDPAPSTSKKADKPTSDERIAAVKAAATVEEVNKLLEGETAKTVKAAGAERIAELTKAAETDERNENGAK